MRAKLQKAFDRVSNLPEEQQEALANTLLKMDCWDVEHGPMFQLDVSKELQALGVSEHEFEQLVQTMRNRESACYEQ